MNSPRTLYDKLFESHWIGERSDGSSLIYIDRHLLHEVTSPQAFAGLHAAGRPLWRRDANVATADHNVPTTDRDRGLDGIDDAGALIQVKTLDENCARHDILHYGIDSELQGIVHIIGPELGLSLPGMSLVCGDSHTSTHGALAILAQGIGTSEVEHVLATQSLVHNRLKNLQVHLSGTPAAGVSAKDMILALIRRIGTAGGSGHAMEFAGPTVEALSIEARMTLCNMAIEAGSRIGLVAFDATTRDYVEHRRFAPRGESWERALEYWEGLHSDAGAHFDRTVELDVGALPPQVSWGTSPEMVCGIDESIPEPESPTQERALEYMDLKPGARLSDIRPNKVFIGSCTNARIEDLRTAAEVVQGSRVAEGIDLAMVVPGSGSVDAQARSEGLDRVFTEAGFEWRAPGCSMCLGMNPDSLAPQDRCASTSNRNFEGRQGYGGRTHLVSPAMAAAAAIHGRFVDVRELGGAS
ncbi:MAG: 3-isopropylmalate dehydratase large subunit [Gammaproteobacteria bacterium AqS3]|nr:3-isopropylmalate dehydratase large subunit [Gammaproteobacteria bacterium AqS3]